MNFADIYGRGTGLGVKVRPGEASAADASGSPDAVKNAPAFSWLLIVGVLALARLIWEYAE